MRSTRARCDSRCPGPSSTSRPPSTTVRPICEDVRHRGAEALRDLSERFDGVRPDAPAGARPRCWPPPWTASTRDVRAALEESIRRARLVHEDQRRTDTTTQVVPGGTVTERWVPGRPGRPLRPRRPRRLRQQRRHERRPRPGRRVSARWPWPARPSATTRRASPATRNPTILAACALLGVDEVYAVGGAQAIAMFAYGASETDRTATGAGGRLRAGQPGHRPRQHLRRRGQAAAQGPDRHRLRGRARPRSRSSPTTRADAGHVAADLISQAEHDPLAAVGPGHRQRGAGRRGRAGARATGSPPPSTPSGSAPR